MSIDEINEGYSLLDIDVSKCDKTLDPERIGEKLAHEKQLFEKTQINPCWGFYA